MSVLDKSTDRKLIENSSLESKNSDPVIIMDNNSADFSTLISNEKIVVTLLVIYFGWMIVAVLACLPFMFMGNNRTYTKNAKFPIIGAFAAILSHCLIFEMFSIKQTRRARV